MDRRYVSSWDSQPTFSTHQKDAFIARIHWLLLKDTTRNFWMALAEWMAYVGRRTSGVCVGCGTDWGSLSASAPIMRPHSIAASARVRNQPAQILSIGNTQPTYTHHLYGGAYSAQHLAARHSRSTAASATLGGAVALPMRFVPIPLGSCDVPRE